MATIKQKVAEQQAIKELRELFIPVLQSGEKPVLQTILRHVSRSGMMRLIDVIYITKQGETLRLNHLIEQLGTYKRPANSDSLKVEGCGMDMGFAVVHSMGYSLFPSAEENASFKLNGRNGDETETSGAYLLRQEWL